MFVNPYLYYSSLFGETDAEPPVAEPAMETPDEDADDAGER
ncbi:hypothetical protein [Azonexus fungiphilus]|nr:hypothetical protein [Azonexus fungiphilus]